MATMKQIADLAGVSRGTVDRVLNNRGIVNEETARKVRRIAESLNYTPSIAARSLAAIKRSIKLLYIIPDPERGPFFRKVLESMRCMRGHLIEFCIFCVSFAGWYLLSSLFGQYMCILFYPYIHIAQAIFLNRLILARRRKDAPAPETADEENKENQ